MPVSFQEVSPVNELLSAAACKMHSTSGTTGFITRAGGVGRHVVIRQMFPMDFTQYAQALLLHAQQPRSLMMKQLPTG